MAEQEREPTIQELIEAWVENRDDRYVLIGPPERVAEGYAIIYDTKTGMVEGIDENDALHRDVIRRILRAGVLVLPRVPPPPKE